MKPAPPDVKQQSASTAVDDTIWSRVVACLEAASDRKALDPVVLDLREASQVADYFVILSGRSDTQVRAVAEAVEQRARQSGVRPIAVEGLRHGQWVLLDFGDFIVHVFYEPVRRFYEIERLWSRAPRVELPVLFADAAAASGSTPLPPR